MTQKVTFCDWECEPCLGVGEATRQTKSFSSITINHTKNIDASITIGPTVIPLRKRNRVFSLTHERGWKKEYEAVVVDYEYNQYDCNTEESLWKLSVTENATWTDSAIYIADTQHNNAFWQEVVYKCAFSGTSKDTTGFIMPRWAANKLRFNDVHYNVTRTWKLMLNGNVEILYSESYIMPMYSSEHPLFFVYPMPMSGVSVDPDFGEWTFPPGTVVHNYSFLDYRTGGFGPGAEEIASGGQDYYHPEYLWYMGDHREEDQNDAVTRFNDTYGAYTNVHDKEVRNQPFPRIWGPEDPRGSIIRDFAGNTFASVTVTKQDGDLLHFNRFVSSDGTSIDIPETIPGSDVRYYPVGLI